MTRIQKNRNPETTLRDLTRDELHHVMGGCDDGSSCCDGSGGCTCTCPDCMCTCGCQDDPYTGGGWKPPREPLPV